MAAVLVNGVLVNGPVQYMQERKKVDPLWLTKPVAKDFVGARTYLGLIMPDARADLAVEALKKAPPASFRATDLVRASRLGLIDKKDPGVQKAMEELESGVAVSPVLLLQGTDDPEANMVIADGWHRIHACYYLDPHTVVPCRIAKGVFDERI